jgi:hypothetical protein
MIQTSSSTLLDRSRLVSLLTELSLNKLSAADYNLAERLGHLLGLSGSINLAQALRQKPQQESVAANVDAEGLSNEVLVARKLMIQRVSRSFDHEPNELANKVPTANVAIRAAALLTYDPYQRFYNTYQVEIGVEVQNLRIKVRKKVSDVSAQLAQLAVLDATLEQSLAVHNRKLFSVTPKLLEQRFKTLLKEHQQNSAHEIDSDPKDWLISGAWLDLFYRDMRELLLAEFDVRLQPVFGLLEALNEHTKTLS